MTIHEEDISVKTYYEKEFVKQLPEKIRHIKFEDLKDYQVKSVESSFGYYSWKISIVSRHFSDQVGITMAQACDAFIKASKKAGLSLNELSKNLDKATKQK